MDLLENEMCENLKICLFFNRAHLQTSSFSPSASMTIASCSFNLPLLAASLLSTPIALAFSTSPQPPTIQVYDGVLSEAASTLHESAKAVGLGHRAFARPLKADGIYNPIERALDKILLEMDGDGNGNDNTYVEYWARQEWRSIEAHADVDEFRAKEEDSSSEAPAIAALGPDGYRYPKFGLFCICRLEVRSGDLPVFGLVDEVVENCSREIKHAPKQAAKTTK